VYGNAYFADLQPTVLIVGAATTAYGNALDAAKSGDKTAIAMKEAKRNDLIALLRKLGDLVSAEAGGDRVKLISSGIPLAKGREPLPLLTKPNPPVLSAGLNAGEVVAEGEFEKAAKAIMHMVTADPITSSSSWKSIVTTSRKYTFTSLESGKKYWFKQCVVGSKEQYVESDPVSYIAQ
jgi:hypothetical protein